MGGYNLLSIKNIVIVLSTIIIVEVVWAGLSLTKTTPKNPPVSVPVSNTTPNSTNSISLQADKIPTKVGEKVNVSINISSDKKTAGADLIINYDPKLLSVEVVGSSAPVAKGNIYSDFPLNKVDTKLGKITVSGITDKSGGTIAQGLFGTIVFTAKAPGVAKVFLDFTKGSTADSNITDASSNQDILEKVTDVELNILP